MSLAKHALIRLSKKQALWFIFITAPLLNFFIGLGLEMYAPSVPSVIEHFNASYTQGHRTLTSYTIGFSIGCLVLGALIDLKGKRKIILISLLAFSILSLLIVKIEQIWVLQFFRIGQGFFAAAFSIGSRVLIFDNFSGLQYKSGITYIAFSFALGTIIAPLLSTHLLDVYHWHAIFITFAVLGLVFFIYYFLLVNEGSSKKVPLSFSGIVNQYGKLIRDKTFLAANLLLGTLVFQLISFSLLMPHFFVSKFNTPIQTFGFYAMTVGSFALLGTLTNRYLITRYNAKAIISFGLVCLGACFALYLMLAAVLNLSPMTTLVPFCPLTFLLGMIIPNVIAETLKLHPKYSGITAAAQLMLYMFFCTFLIGIANGLHFDTLLGFGFYLAIIFVVQAFLYCKLVKNHIS